MHPLTTGFKKNIKLPQERLKSPDCGSFCTCSSSLSLLLKLHQAGLEFPDEGIFLLQRIIFLLQYIIFLL